MAPSGRRAANTNHLAKKISAVLISLTLAAGTVVAVNSVASASGNFTVPAGGLNFTNPVTIENVTSGTIRTYENVDGNGTVAKVEVVSLTNSDAEITGPNWAIEWGGFHLDSQVADPNFANFFHYRVAYKLDTDADFTLSAPVSADTTTRMSLTNLRSVADRNSYTFQVRAFDSSGNLLSTSDSLENTTSLSSEGFTARHRWSITSNRLEYLDRKTLSSTVIDGFLRTQIWRDNDNLLSAATVKVSFESSQGVARTFTSLRLNSYDLDNEQFLEYFNVDRADITEGSNILSVSATGARQHLVQAKLDDTDVNGSGNAAFSDPLSTSYTAGKVSVMYSNVSQLSFRFGFPGNGDSTASFEFDFGDRVAAAVAESQPVSATPTQTPQVAALDVSPTNITVANEIITVLGANLDRVESVWIGGVNVPITTKTKNRLQVRAPSGLSGLVDLELKSPLNDVLLVKELSFGSVAAPGTRKATLIVGGFDHNSRKLTARMQARIDRWLDRNSDLSTLTCTGFTSLPRRTTDVALSTNRGITACDFSKSQRPELKTSVSQGIEDPRPGSNVRRVRLVLTP